MKLVFQYGSNTLSTRLNSDERLCGDARDRGLAYTEVPFELDFDVWSTGNNCAAADLRETGGRLIWGVLYGIPNGLIRRETAGKRKSLDAIEGEGTQYSRRSICVRWPDGTPVADDVITYTALTPKPGLLTSVVYASHIVAGLKEHGAPEEYIAYVKGRVVANNPDLAHYMERL